MNQGCKHSNQQEVDVAAHIQASCILAGDDIPKFPFLILSKYHNTYFILSKSSYLKCKTYHNVFNVKYLMIVFCYSFCFSFLSVFVLVFVLFLSFVEYILYGYFSFEINVWNMETIPKAVCVLPFKVLSPREVQRRQSWETPFPCFSSSCCKKRCYC